MQPNFVLGNSFDFMFTTIAFKAGKEDEFYNYRVRAAHHIHYGKFKPEFEQHYPTLRWLFDMLKKDIPDASGVLLQLDIFGKFLSTCIDLTKADGKTDDSCVLRTIVDHHGITLHFKLDGIIKHSVRLHFLKYVQLDILMDMLKPIQETVDIIMTEMSRAITALKPGLEVTEVSAVTDGLKITFDNGNTVYVCKLESGIFNQTNGPVIKTFDVTDWKPTWLAVEGLTVPSIFRYAQQTKIENSTYLFFLSTNRKLWRVVSYYDDICCSIYSCTPGYPLVVLSTKTAQPTPNGD